MYFIAYSPSQSIHLRLTLLSCTHSHTDTAPTCQTSEFVTRVGFSTFFATSSGILPLFLRRKAFMREFILQVRCLGDDNESGSTGDDCGEQADAPGFEVNFRIFGLFFGGDC